MSSLRTPMSWAWIVLLGLHYLAVCQASKTEYDLIKDLMASYDIDVRPSENQTTPVTVKLGMALNQIIDLDERNQILTVKTWMRYEWTDSNLKWNASDYSNITEIRLKATRIWRPDITLYSDLRESMSDTQKIYPALISNAGVVKWNAPEILRSTCNLDVTHFPWDEQRCMLQFGSWTYDASKIDLENRSTSGDLNTFVGSGEWVVVAFPLKRNVEYYACCTNPFVDLSFYLIIRRKPLYYLFNLVLPAVFITATTVLVFYLPPDSGEKVSLGVTVLLALTVFLLLVAEIMPPQSDSIPLIGEYFEATIVLLALSTALTVIILNIHHRGMFSNKVPFWVRKVILGWLATPLCLRSKIDANLSESTSNKVSNQNGVIKKGEVIQVMAADTIPSVVTTQNQFLTGSATTSDVSIRQIADMLTEFRDSHRQTEEEDTCKRDWMLVAMVIDRFLLVVFFFLTIVVSTVILTNHPIYVDGVYDPIP